jgi:hypothetical protein
VCVYLGIDVFLDQEDATREDAPEEARGDSMKQTPNKPAAPNAGIAPQFTIERHWRGVGELER